MTGEKQSPIPSRDWRKEADYKNLERLDRRGFAWEYLRRNPGYRDERKHEPVFDSELHRDIRVIVSPSSTSLSTWGLRFRGGIRRRSATGENLLG